MVQLKVVALCTLQNELVENIGVLVFEAVF